MRTSRRNPGIVNKWLTQKHLMAFAAVLVLVLAAKTPDFSVSRGGSSRLLLPGDPLPTVDYATVFAAPEPIRRITTALVMPIEAAAERLRPFAERIFPSSFWAEAKPPASHAPYTVRDTALKMVREKL